MPKVIKRKIRIKRKPDLLSPITNNMEATVDNSLISNKPREKKSFLQTTNDFTTSLRRLALETTLLKESIESANEQIQDALQDINEVNAMFSKHI